MYIVMLFHSQLFMPLRHQFYRKLLFSNVLMHTGMWMTITAAAWHMTKLTDSDFLVGLTQTFSTLPVFLLALLAGHISDRYKKSSYLLSAILGCIITLVVYVIASSLYLSITPVSLLFFLFFLNCFAAMIWPAWQAAVSIAIPKKDINNAALLNGLSFNLGRTLGPALAGIVVGFFGIKFVFIVNAILLSPLAFVLFKWKRYESIPSKKCDGLIKSYRGVLESKKVQGLLMITMVTFFSTSGFWSLLPVLISQSDFRSLSFSSVMALSGAGAIIGALMAPPIRDRVTSKKLIVFSMIGFSLINIISPYLVNSYWIYVALTFLGILTPWHIATINAKAQTISSLASRAKVLALNLVSMYGGMAIGGGVWGSVSQDFTPVIALAICSVCLMISSLIVNRFFSL